MNGDLLRTIDVIHREKDIDKEVLFEGIEQALLTAAKKRFGQKENLTVRIDRTNGEIRVLENDSTVVPIDLGRIAAQTAKQVIIQKIREAERDHIYTEFETREKTIVAGTIHRFEGNNVVVMLGRTEALLPKHEQVRGESYHLGERIRAFVVEVKKLGPKVKIVLSRTHPDLVRRLFELEVPEIGEKLIEIKAISREPGYRTKIAVHSVDSKIDCVGACVGVRGTRIKSIGDELNGEKVEIIPWSADPETMIVNALKPAVVQSILIDEREGSATVIVGPDQLSLSIGKKGQNVRLASKLAGYDLSIVTKEEYEAGQVDMSRRRGLREEPEGETGETDSPPDSDVVAGPASEESGSGVG